MSYNSGQGSSSLAKFAFNIYGTLNQHGTSQSPPNSHSSRPSPQDLSSKLSYSFEKEVNCLSQLCYPVQKFQQTNVNHVVVGGKNYLRLLTTNADQNRIVHETDILDSGFNARGTSAPRLSSINTIKTRNDTIACGLTNGTISIYKIQNNGKSVLSHKLASHKRCINSLDFLNVQDDSSQIISGSQDGTIKVWDLRMTASRPTMTISQGMHSDPIRSCQYSPHSVMRNNRVNILSVHDSGALVKWDLRSSQYIPERKWTFHTGPALSLHVNPEAEFVITAGRDQKLCVWNYSESNTISPLSVVNSYGPVAKVRWSPYPTEDDKETSTISSSSSSLAALFHYDFACTYLNDDPTITTYNLSRKYIPKEIITTNKPFQNFIWGHHTRRSRNIWTLTKGNQFTSYNLNSNSEEISRPLENLPSAAFSWSNTIGDFSFVNQHKNDFNLLEQDDILESEDDLQNLNLMPNSNSNNVNNSTNTGAITSSMLSNFGSTPVSSPLSIDRSESPSIDKTAARLGSYNATKPINTPIPHPRAINIDSSGSLPSSRPMIYRNPSQSTQESITPTVPSPVPTGPHQNQRNALHCNQSSYLIPISINIPQNDEEVFEGISSNYLLEIPDGFNIIDVCLLNANLAASHNKFRDCQIWRVLAVALEDESDYGRSTSYSGQDYQYSHNDNDSSSKVNDSNSFKSFDNKDKANDTHSMSSAMDNFAGSFNSSSTTNYGVESSEVGSVPSNGILESRDACNSLHSGSGNSISPDKIRSRINSFTENGNSSGNLMDMINTNRGAVLSISPSAARSNHLYLKATEEHEESEVKQDQTRSEIPKPTGTSERHMDSDSAIMDDEEDISDKAVKKYHSMPQFNNSNANPLEFNQLKNSSLDSIKGQKSFKSSSLNKPFVQDLDNENINLISTGGYADSFSSSCKSFSISPSAMNLNYSRRNSTRTTSRNKLTIQKQELNKVQEEVTVSELTKAINKDEERKSIDITDNEVGKDSSNLFKPWKLQPLLEEALNYAVLQGDIIMCSTLTILFYDSILCKSNVIKRENCLEWIGMYIDILRQKRLFITAMDVINHAPETFKQELTNAYTNDVSLRFYCSWCKKLLVNEETKMKNNDRFGYWYCDECSRLQSGCVYCHEPCQGLNVVVSLNCGHRGHFGCLKDWFVDGANVECPGGCDNKII